MTKQIVIGTKRDGKYLRFCHKCVTLFYTPSQKGTTCPLCDKRHFASIKKNKERILKELSDQGFDISRWVK